MRNRKAVAISLIAIVFALVAFICPSEGGDPSTLLGASFEKYRLKNGMIVILMPDHSSPVVAMNIWVSVGSFDESADESGMSHFIEHMVFKGTSKMGPGEAASIIESSGGYFNAYTSYDITVYHATVSSRFTKNMIFALGGTVLDATFPEDGVERERMVVLEEIRMNLDNKERRITKFIFESAFTDHPYGRPILGTMETIGGFSRDDLFGYYQTHYCPSNMVAVLVGDFDPKDVKPMIEEYLGSVPKANAPKKPSFDTQVNSGLIIKGLFENVNIGYLDIGFNIPPIDHNDLYALDVLSLIMGEGRGSRLYRRLVDDKKLLYDINVYSYTPREAGLFLITSHLDPDLVGTALTTIAYEFERLKGEAVTEEELSCAKTIIRTDFIYEKESFEGICDSLGFFEAIVGDVRFEKTYLKGIESVTKEDIMRVAKEYFTPENLTIAYLFPENQEEMIPDDLIRDATLEGFSERADKTVDVPELITGPMGYEAVLENGVRVVIKEDDTLPIVAVTVAFLGGLRYENSENNGINNLISTMLTRGTTNLSSKALTDSIDKIAGDFYGFSGRNSFGLTAKFLKEYEDIGWELIGDIIVNPTFSSDELIKLKEIIYSSIDARKDDLARKTFDGFKETLYGNHPYAMPTIGTKESIGAISRDDIVAYYTSFAVPSNMVISVCGDVDAEDVLKWIVEIFSTLRGEEIPPPENEAPMPPTSPRKVRERIKEKEQAHIFMGFMGADIKSDDYYVLEVLTTILSGHGGRLFYELREKRGLAYSVQALNIAGLDPGFFGVYMATKPETLDLSIDGINEELKKIKSEGVTHEELLRAQNYLVGNYELGLQENVEIAMTMALDELYGLGYDFSLAYPDRIYAITMDDVLKMAEKYIDFDKVVLSVVGP